MSWNDGLERKKFERRWSQEEKAYREAGMSEEQILSMREFEEEQYRSNRRYQMHTQPLIASDFGEDEGDEKEDKSCLFNKFQTELTVTMEYRSDSRFGWIDEIENERLVIKLKQLPENDLELITMIAFDGLTQIEIAEKSNISHQSVSKKLKRLKKFLR